MITKRSVLLTLALLVGFVAQASALQQRLKLEGVWSDGRFIVDRVKERDPEKDPRRIRISGRVRALDSDTRRLSIGPAVLTWVPAQDADLESVQAGDAFEFDANLDDTGEFRVLRFEPIELEADDTIELIGAVFRSTTIDRVNRVSIAGIPAYTPKRLYHDGRVRIARLDDRRPAEQLSFRLGEVRVTVGGEIEFNLDVAGNADLDNDREDRRLDLEPGFQLESFFEISDTISGFLELKGEHNRRYDIPLSLRREDSELSRGESWLYIDALFGSSLSLQIGRQNFAEQREWWWDDDLDAFRVQFNQRSFRAEIAVAESVAKVVFNDDHEDAEEQGVLRVLGSASWRYSSKLTADVFFLYQKDHSDEYTSGAVVPFYSEDEDDAELTWFGTRFSGDFDLGPTVEAAYWIDWALVRGTEIAYEFDDLDDLRSVVESTRKFHRSGEAFDVGTSVLWADARWWIFEEPTVTVGFAWGSGGDGGRNTFRETGLNDNNGKFNGVDRFRYYGELVDPKLENLGVTTAALGFRFWEESSIELLHHHYVQAEKSTSHSLDLDPDATGKSSSLGDEFDVVIGIEEWQHWELEFVGAYFLPGNAFIDTNDAWQVSFKLNYNF